MIDKLSNIGGAAQGSSNKAERVSKKEKMQKAAGKEAVQKSSSKSSEIKSGAQVNISEIAREMLKLRAEAERYLKMVQDKPTLSPEDLDDIQNKLKNNHYLRQEVVDKIVDKLLDLPNFTKKD